MTPQTVARLNALPDRDPQFAIVGEMDPVVVRFDDEISVFCGRCFHRGALMSDGLSKTGHHGQVEAVGVLRADLPDRNNIRILTAQLVKPPLPDDAEAGTDVVIGPDAQKPLRLKIPLVVSDMSFGALSEPAGIALARGAELAGTGICSGEGGMLPDEQQANSRYFCELAPGRFGFEWEKLSKAQALGGPGATTGTGGHLPGARIRGKIAEVRGLKEGEDAISPARFPDRTDPAQIRDFADEVRDRTGSIPAGYKLSARHIERDINAALEVGVDYIIPDGRGGGTWAAPILFRDNIPVPAIPALARARAHPDRPEHADISLVITGGLRKPADFIKAMAPGADAITLSSSAMEAIWCIAMRASHTNNCPLGIGTQKPHLVSRIVLEKSARQLANFFKASTGLMQVMARACGHDHPDKFCHVDLTTWKKEMAEISGVTFGGAV